MKRKPATKGIPKASTLHGFPRDDRDRLFCEKWLEHFDHTRAYIEAGFATHTGEGSTAKKKGVYSNTTSRALKKLQSFWTYLEPLRMEKARAVAQQVVLNAADVLDIMGRHAKIAVQEFIEPNPTALTESVKNASGEWVTQPLLEDGKPVYGTRLKPIERLTPEQASIVQVTGQEGGHVRYRLPTIRERQGFLVALGRQMGLFLDKIIMETHNHQHQHAHLHLEDVPTAKLKELSAQLMPLVGRDFAAQLGYTADEIDQMIGVDHELDS